MSTLEKIKGILIKKRKSNKWLVSLFLVIVLVVVSPFILGAMMKYGNNKSKWEEGTYNYLISGRGCNDMVDVSDAELKEYLKNDILSKLSEKKFRKILLDKKRGYEEGRYDWDDSCRMMVDRVLGIMNSL